MYASSTGVGFLTDASYHERMERFDKKSEKLITVELGWIKSKWVQNNREVSFIIASFMVSGIEKSGVIRGEGSVRRRHRDSIGLKNVLFIDSPVFWVLRDNEAVDNGFHSRLSLMLSC